MDVDDHFEHWHDNVRHSLVRSWIDLGERRSSISCRSVSAGSTDRDDSKSRSVDIVTTCMKKKNQKRVSFKVHVGVIHASGGDKTSEKLVE